MLIVRDTIKFLREGHKTIQTKKQSLLKAYINKSATKIQSVYKGYLVRKSLDT